MRFLLKGLESERRVNLLLSLTKIDSENIKSALIDHLSNGKTELNAATLNNLSQQNFNRALKRLNTVAGVVEEVKELDWKNYNKGAN